MKKFSINNEPPTEGEISKEKRILRLKKVICLILAVSSLVLFIYLSFEAIEINHVTIKLLGVLSVLIFILSAIFLERYRKEFFELEERLLGLCKKVSPQ